MKYKHTQKKNHAVFFALIKDSSTLKTNFTSYREEALLEIPLKFAVQFAVWKKRMDTNRLPKQAIQYKPKGQRNIGRPRKRWRDKLHLEDQGTG